MINKLSALIKSFLILLKKQNFAYTPTIAVGLSGGPDSVFLLYLIKEVAAAGRCNVIVAHINHGWPATADAEFLWCQQLCAQWGIPIILDHVQNYPVAKHHAGSQEAVGHKQRRMFFDKILADGKADFIALGQHLDDQLETFFIRLARGTSLNGIHGMSEVDGYYLRPLLFISKAEILTHLFELKIDFLDDITNRQDIHLRNKIRNHLIPMLTSCDERFSKNIITTMQRLKQDDTFLDHLAKTTFNTLFLGNPRTAQCSALTIVDHALLRRVILLWLISKQVLFTPSEGLLEEIIRFIQSPKGGSHAISTTHRIIKKSSRIWLENTVG